MTGVSVTVYICSTRKRVVGGMPLRRAGARHMSSVRHGMVACDLQWCCVPRRCQALVACDAEKATVAAE